MSHASGSDKLPRVPFVHPYRRDGEGMSDADMTARATRFEAFMQGRRTVRDFSSTPVARSVIESCIRAAGTAPSGAHKQPWHFAVVEDPDVKRAIREAAEAEERAFYGGRAPEEWLHALAPIGTDADKPFLEIAPVLIAIFARNYDLLPDGSRSKNYYVAESVGLAAGMLITALHHAGLSTLTHTPSPMQFLNDELGRPANARAVILLVVGHAASDAKVPDLDRKPLGDIASFH